MNQQFEYMFIRLGEGWLGVRRDARESYQNVVHHHARRVAARPDLRARYRRVRRGEVLRVDLRAASEQLNALRRQKFGLGTATPQPQPPSCWLTLTTIRFTPARSGTVTSSQRENPRSALFV